MGGAPRLSRALVKETAMVLTSVFLPHGKRKGNLSKMQEKGEARVSTVSPRYDSDLSLILAFL